MPQNGSYDVIILGASFAGVALARSFSGAGRVLLIDRKDPGTRQTSACAMPLYQVEQLGAEKSVCAVHPRIAFHRNGKSHHYLLTFPYCTVDYEVFCREVLFLCDVEFVKAQIVGVENGKVSTTAGEFSGKVIADCSGWRSVSLKGRKYAEKLHLARGVEIELPCEFGEAPDAMHFHFDDFLLDGRPEGRASPSAGGHVYGWAFPCKNTVRFGVIHFMKPGHQIGLLQKLLSLYGLKSVNGHLHGGALPYFPRKNVTFENVFLIGDSAGQCLALTGEGIRPGIFFALHAGNFIQKFILGEISLDEAKTRYQSIHHFWLRSFRNILHVQNLVNLSARTVAPLMFSLGKFNPAYQWAQGLYLGAFSTQGLKLPAKERKKALAIYG